jgi:hypothetical protein
MKPVFLQNKKGDNFFQVIPLIDISWNNNQIPITNHQINSNDPMSKHFRKLVFGYWSLFGDWDLVIGIFPMESILLIQ